MIWLGLAMMLAAAVVFAALLPWGNRPGPIKQKGVETFVMTVLGMFVLIFGAIFAFGVH